MQTDRTWPSPGPWKLAVKDPAIDRDHVAIYSDHGTVARRVIARVNTTGPEDAEGMANAQVLRAALEVIETLEVLIGVVQGGLDRRATRGQVAEALAEARRALGRAAGARGEEGTQAAD